MREITSYIFIFILLPLLSFGQNIVVPYPDNSPSSEDFVAMGFASPDKKWIGEEYNFAINILDQIYEIDKFSLPRKGSDYSGKVFKRMTSIDNFDFLVNEDANLGNQIIQFEDIKGLGFRLLVYYIEDTEPEERFGIEVIECLYLDAWLNTKGIILYDKLLSQLSPGQSSNNNFKRGYEKLARDYKRSIEELFYIFEVDYKRFDNTLLSEFAIIFGQFVHELPDRNTTVGFQYRLELLSKSFPDKNIRKLLKKSIL